MEHQEVPDQVVEMDHQEGRIKWKLAQMDQSGAGSSGANGSSGSAGSLVEMDHRGSAGLAEHRSGANGSSGSRSVEMDQEAQDQVEHLANGSSGSAGSSGTSDQWCQWITRKCGGSWNIWCKWIIRKCRIKWCGSSDQVVEMIIRSAGSEHLRKWIIEVPDWQMDHLDHDHGTSGKMDQGRQIEWWKCNHQEVQVPEHLVQMDHQEVQVQVVQMDHQDQVVRIIRKCRFKWNIWQMIIRKCRSGREHPVQNGSSGSSGANGSGSAGQRKWIRKCRFKWNIWQMDHLTGRQMDHQSAGPRNIWQMDHQEV
jgi:hypothetical protein